MNEVWKIEDVLLLTQHLIKAFSWVSSAKAKDQHTTSTTSYVREVLTGNPQDLSHELRNQIYLFNQMTKSDIAERSKLINDVLAWARGLDPTNDLYLSKLKAVAEQKEVGAADLGILTSIFAAYSRSTSSSNDESAKHSNYVGKVKDKIELKVKVVAKTLLNGRFGPSYIFRMIDEGGNTIIWIAGGDTAAQSGLTVGKTYSIMGTVKAHQTFRGEKQTALTRCKNLGEI